MERKDVSFENGLTLSFCGEHNAITIGFMIEGEFGETYSKVELSGDSARQFAGELCTMVDSLVDEEDRCPCGCQDED